MTTINNYTTWQALLQLVNVQQNGQIPPTVFNMWYNEVNKEVFKELANLYQANQVMSDLLSPFSSISLLQVVSQSGQNFGLCKYPSDYQYFVGSNVLTQLQEDECFKNSDFPIIDDDGKAQRYTDPDYAQLAINYAGANTEEGQAQLVDSQRWASCLTHKTKGPTLAAPKILQFQGGFRVAPKGVASMVLYYLKTPKDSVFAYTVSNQDILIYDASNSTQLEWSDQVQPWFLAILVKKYGLYINSDSIMKMGDDLLTNITKR